ncbi:hypothetical protein [Arthrobacter sp. StoSoilB13]|uniref:hypothetical protein n=1 Tax=Arthrobacter sp. StoSoilB13 TaxID=2830993 RepID=UPI003209CFED
MLEIWGTREAKVLGSGSEEYKRVIATSAWLFGFVAIFSYALKIDTARGYVGLAFPAGAIALLVARWLVRQHLSLERQRGRSMSRVLIIGGPHSAQHLVRSLQSAPQGRIPPCCRPRSRGHGGIGAGGSPECSANGSRQRFRFNTVGHHYQWSRCGSNLCWS